jgi:hypothetical protein
LSGGCRVGTIRPITAAAAGPEGVRCAAPAHAPRAAVVGRGFHSFTLELNLSNPRTHS